MNDTTDPVAIKIREARQRRGASYREFAEEFTRKMVNVDKSQTTIMNWEKGISSPETDFLLKCLAFYLPGDWQRELAIDCLTAKLPEVFERADHGIRLLV